MLTQIDLQNFKCFSTLKLPLKPLTLLAGANASGKSTVLQALVLLHQTMREHEWSSGLVLNGGATRLGSAGDILDQLGGRGTCGIGLEEHSTTKCNWEFRGEREDMTMAMLKIEGESDAVIWGMDEHGAKLGRKKIDGAVDWNMGQKQPLRFLIPQFPESPSIGESLTKRLRSLSYLTAERLGPRETYPLQGLEQSEVVGPKGEHAVSVLYSGRDSRVLEQLVVSDFPPTLLRQVEAHMSRFFPSFELILEKIPRYNGVTLGVRTSRSTDFHRPTHTGFGLTQVLPIIVAALSLPRNGLLLVENPEVHLHPAGQAAMGKFLAEVAAADVQVLLETHSDHVLNGIRRSLKQGILSPDATAIHFFRSRLDAETKEISQVESPMLDMDGSLDSWPDGFFDQFDKDMNYFAGWD